MHIGNDRDITVGAIAPDNVAALHTARIHVLFFLLLTSLLKNETPLIQIPYCQVLGTTYSTEVEALRYKLEGPRFDPNGITGFFL
jgi:hypothetical protein